MPAVSLAEQAATFIVAGQDKSMLQDVGKKLANPRATFARFFKLSLLQVQVEMKIDAVYSFREES